MVSSLPLPTPDPSSDVWGEDLNAAITAVNNDLESTKTVQAGKADSAAVTAALAQKADTSTVTGLASQIGAKADIAYVDSALATKADTSDVSGKADQAALDAAVSAIDGKADQTEVDSALASKADAAALTALSTTVNSKANQADLDILETTIDDLGSPPIFLQEGEMIPAGTPAGTVIYRSDAYPKDIKITHVSGNKSEPITNFELPDDLKVGDVLMAIAVTMNSGRSYVWSSPWQELFDYSQPRTTSAAIYRIVDEAALAAVTAPVITPSGNFDSMVLAIVKIEAQVETAWPAYSSSVGRSGNTLTSPTNTSFIVGVINNSPFTSFDTEWIFGAAYSTIIAGPAPVITLPNGFETVIDATTGGLSFKLAKRPFSALPVPAQTIGVSHPTGFANANYGGAHFITPTKEA